MLVVGEKDTKFVEIAHQMARTRKRTALSGENGSYRKSIVEGNSPADKECLSRLELDMKAKGADDYGVTELLVVERSGHNLPVESPLRLVKAVREFAATVGK